ncbi:MAG: glutamine-hydrolyzing GMP synthase [Candidatus Sungbacteria bacterium]|nr:glutamine-hydrolyzing GMP synthase [bacterium]MDZ4285375.1 glutamine-hydrolyzing GMP synthase [Candidatus Sungbacteria bacterium]
MEPQIVVVDLGGQYTQLLARKIREQGVRSVVLSPQAAGEILASCKPKGIILSGGWASIYNADAPHVPDSILTAGVPVLGVCLGMQWLAKKLGGTVESYASQREYGVYEFKRMAAFDPLFRDIPEKSLVRLSHGDSVTVLPAGAYRSGMTQNCGIASFTIPDKQIFGVQFHPECADTDYGSQILKNFLEICGTAKDWNSECLVTQIRSEVLAAVPKGAKLLHLFSGGVDSTVIAKILEPVFQDRLVCIFIDTGSLREGEIIEVRRNAVAASCSLLHFEAKQEFMAAMNGLVGGETKRLAFQGVYRRKMEELKATFKTSCVTQGTLATDLIESGQEGGASVIKIHHNVGVDSINPLRSLFKDEVRDLARFLGLPDFVSERMPFPGLGLFIRVVGIPITEETMGIVHWADARGREIIRASGCEQEISQLVIGVGLPTVGVKGDGRVDGYAALVRAVQSVDFMTASGYEIPSLVRRRLINALMQHDKIVRVLFDETPKPPGTIEFE